MKKEFLLKKKQRKIKVNFQKKKEESTEEAQERERVNKHSERQT